MIEGVCDDADFYISLGQAARLIESLRDVHQDMPIGAALTFLHIASEEGLSITELSKKCRDNLATTSRYVQALGSLRHDKKPGLGLVATYCDELEHRRKVVVLTPAGRLLAYQLRNVVAG